MWKELLQASINRDPPEPQFEGELPTDKEFYADGIPEWTDDES